MTALVVVVTSLIITSLILGKCWQNKNCRCNDCRKDAFHFGGTFHRSNLIQIGTPCNRNHT